MIDLLDMMHRGELSTEEADNILDETIERVHSGEGTMGWREALRLSPYEATAYAQGATVEDLVKLRYEGWPTACCRCHLPIDYKLFGWWFRRSSNGQPQIRHIQCPIDISPNGTPG